MADSRADGAQGTCDGVTDTSELDLVLEIIGNVLIELARSILGGEAVWVGWNVAIHKRALTVFDFLNGEHEAPGRNGDIKESPFDKACLEEAISQILTLNERGQRVDHQGAVRYIAEQAIGLLNEDYWEGCDGFFKTVDRTVKLHLPCIVAWWKQQEKLTT